MAANTGDSPGRTSQYLSVEGCMGVGTPQQSEVWNREGISHDWSTRNRQSHAAPRMPWGEQVKFTGGSFAHTHIDHTNGDAIADSLFFVVHVLIFFDKHFCVHVCVCLCV